MLDIILLLILGAGTVFSVLEKKRKILKLTNEL